MSTAISCEGLSKSYADRPALRSLDLEVEAGCVLGLLGPNGAGKTTAIRVLTTVLAPDGGTFRVAGVGQDEPHRIRRLVGALPESSGFSGAQTGAEALTFFAELYGLPRPQAQARARELLDEVGLAERANSLVGGYSRGMRQRLGIARSLVNRPEVVFLDEPTLGLDPAGQRQVVHLLAGLAGELGSTVVLSTHLLSEVEESCDRVLILNRGRVVADGSVDAVSRLAGRATGGRLRVPPGSAAAAVHVLTELAEVAQVAPGGTDGDLRLGLQDWVGDEQGANRVLAALLEAGLTVLAFELERRRLSDAFLELTAEP